jgi:putative heme iron utilization protein
MAKADGGRSGQGKHKPLRRIALEPFIDRSGTIVRSKPAAACVWQPTEGFGESSSLGDDARSAPHQPQRLPFHTAYGHPVAPMSDLGLEARQFVRAHPNGVLSTLSKRLGGMPFGSIAPFMLDHEGRPIILISTLAEHTKNLDADPRASIIAHPCAQDAQAAGRVTLVGRASRLPDKDALGPRYLRYLPEAESYFGMHDFFFYRMEVEAVRFIGGFGKIHWIATADFAPPANGLAASEPGILAHMNADHAHNLRAYCVHLLALQPQDVSMIGVDTDGFDLRVDGSLRRIDFPAPVHDAAEVRKALVDLAQRCREHT